MSSVYAAKQICLMRCLSALALSMLMQFLLLTVFLLFIKFHILHPVEWLTQTVSVLFSFYTWLAITPLLSAVLFYGILLGKAQLSAKKYYPSRFKWLAGTAVHKILFMNAHVAVGFLTACLYVRFLHEDYRNFLTQCYGATCVNSSYTFLISAGIVASSYHFVKEHMRQEPEVEFPVIHEAKLVQIRSILYATMYKSLLKSFVPTLAYAVGYWMLGSALSYRLADMIGIEHDNSLDTLYCIFTNWRLLFYTWILTSQIISNMHLMQNFFSIFLASPHHFSVESNPMLIEGTQDELTLTQAFEMDQMPVIQSLAALELYNIAQRKDSSVRQQIFSLSVPGGHPYNWNQIATQALSLIDVFIDQFAVSVKKISNMKSTPLFATIKVSATDTADKILLRQYNETYGIRRLVPETVIPDQSTAALATNCNKNQNSTNACERINAQFEEISRQIEQVFRTAFRIIPGLYYTFGEPDGAKATFLLSNAQTIVWLTQGLSGICAVSLVEDKYGVVQVLLPRIIKTLLRLKLELDKLNNVILNGRKCDRNLITLRSAVRRSLYKICAVFGDYLHELVEDHDDYRRLQCFVSYQET